MKRFCGRNFDDSELTQINQLIKDNPQANRLALSRLVCKMLDWYKPDGGLKEMSCRVAMIRMEKAGLLMLPKPRTINRSIKKILPSSQTDPQSTISKPVHHLGTLTLDLVKPKESRLWNEYIERYHYLGFKTLPGAQLRYFVRCNQQIIALLGFGAAAWQVAPRDHFIGWTHEQRQNHLHLIVNNARFLILPWVQSKNLASKILSRVTRQLPNDWNHRYHIRPVLMETFVDTERYKGTSYQAANWTFVGKTKGRGKLEKKKKQVVPIKDIWIYPLNPNFRKILQNNT